MPTRSRISRSGLALVICFLAGDTLTEAIVRRHDVKDARYLKLGRPHTAVGRILPDGTGTLIAPDWVLTAAHVGQNLKPGQATISFKKKKYEIAEVIIHPKGVQSSASAPPEVDMALLRLEKPVRKIKPVGLNREAIEIGEQVVFVGYGDIGDGRSPLKRGDGRRRAATNDITGVDEHHLFFTFDEPPEGTELEGVSGPGDSGGPALIEVDGKTLVAGLSSGSTGEPGRYGITEVYARVSVQIAWIEETIGHGD